MERILDNDETSRRAKEIYSRRNGINLDSNRKKYFSIYKFLFQLLVLLNLSIVFVLYNNRNFVFSGEFLNQVNNFYNINIYQKINDFFAEESENETKAEKEDVNSQNNAENIKEIENEEEKKECYSFIKPLDGTITSFFGERESNNSKVSKYHTGIDISASENTIIKSANFGKVILVSDKGNYGKHLMIQNDNIITVYAHCNSIFVNEGDEIFQGQEIAKVGSTGNSTGPHLHFEIRCNDEYLNPLDYVEF